MVAFKTLVARHKALAPLENMEVALARTYLDCPGSLSEREEAELRYAISLARLTEVRTSDGRDVDVSELVTPLRTRLSETLGPLLLDHRGPVKRPEIGTLLPIVGDLAAEHRDRLRERTRDLLPWSDIDTEIRNKRLVLACGGGGGAGHVYLGAFQSLEERKLTPALIAGTSIGAVLGAFRARYSTFDTSYVPKIIDGLVWRSVLRPISARSRYGLPGPLRLHLEPAVGRYFTREDGTPMTLDELAIPFMALATGIRQGELPHEPEWYEHKLDIEAAGEARRLGPAWARDVIKGLWRAVSDLAQRPNALRALVLGSDAVTRSYDVIDAIGFSSAVPGVIHYEPSENATRMAALLDYLFEQREILRLTDGALVDNVPARSAWRAVQSGRIGTRNVLVVALDCFAPKLTQPLWIPVQRLPRPNVVRSLRYAHIVKPFARTLSPLDVVPSPQQMQRAILWGREEMAHEMPLIERLLKPLPPLP